jgi:hypothetical protein
VVGLNDTLNLIARSALFDGTLPLKHDRERWHGRFKSKSLRMICRAETLRVAFTMGAIAMAISACGMSTAQQDATLRFGRAASLYATIYTQNVLQVSAQANELREAKLSLGTSPSAQDVEKAVAQRFQVENERQLRAVLGLAAALQQYGDALTYLAESRASDVANRYLSRTGRNLWVASKALASVPTPGSTLTLITTPAEERFRRTSIQRMLAEDAPEVSDGMRSLAEELDASRAGSLVSQYSSEIAHLTNVLEAAKPAERNSDYCQGLQMVSIYALLAQNRDFLESFEPAQREAGLSLARANEALAALFRSDSQDTEAINSFADSVAQLSVTFQLLH